MGIAEKNNAQLYQHNGFNPIEVSLTEELFDIGVVDTDPHSHHACSPHDVLGSAEIEKKRNGLSRLACHIYSALCFCRWYT